MHRDITVIANDIRSTYNIGSLLRTCEGLGISEVICTGYTPYPAGGNTDDRLPHIVHKLNKQIDKTALGAQHTLSWRYHPSIFDCITQLKHEDYEVVGLEQAAQSIPLPQYQPGRKVALLLGREVEGIDPLLIEQCDTVVEIPMLGRKESFNVVQAAAMALYQLRFAPLD